MASAAHPARRKNRGGRSNVAPLRGASVPLPLLEDLVVALAEGAVEELPPGPCLIGLPDPHLPEPHNMGIREVDGRDALALRKVPIDRTWGALVAVLPGWSAGRDAFGDVDPLTLAIDGPMPSQRPDRRRVVMVEAVSRDGATSSAVSMDGEELHTHSRPVGAALDDGGPTGPYCDALRRCFGLSTAPAPVPTTALWAALWLGEVAQFSRPGDELDWATVASCHPALRMFGDGAPLPMDDGTCVTVGPELLEMAGRVMGRVLDWPELRRRTRRGQWPVVGIDRDDAGWADDGMYARLCLRSVEPVWSSMRRVAEACDAVAAARLQETLVSWEVAFAPPGAPPAAPS